MKKSWSNRFFLPFFLLIGVNLAVLGFGIGQLFPYFVDNYTETKNEQSIQALENSIENKDIQLTELEKKQLLQSVTTEVDDDTKKELESKLIMVIIIFLLMVFFVLTYFTHRLLSNLVEPIENVTETARELTMGNYQARAFATGPRTITNLRNSINMLASNLQELTKKRAVEEERLQTLIENMGSALLMIDRAGEALIVNQAFLQRFNYLYDDVIGKNFMMLEVPDELKTFIDYVFLTELPYRKQLQMTIDQEIMHKMAYGAPVVGEHGKWHGVVIVLHDISELIRLEHIRKDFVANVSHELRTPVTSIKGFSETLLDGAYKDEKMALSFLEIIHEESNRLQELITDLLELSKIEQHGFSVNLAPTSLEQVLSRVEDITKQRLEEKHISYCLHMDHDLIVNGDNNRLIQIFTNIVYNAIMYSPEHTSIQVNVYTSEGMGVVEVVDQGVGIQKEEIPRIFERFYRVDRARSRNSGGTGLGLAIVKHLVEAHEGKIQVLSEVGKGTCVRVFIPLT